MGSAFGGGSGGSAFDNSSKAQSQSTSTVSQKTTTNTKTESTEAGITAQSGQGQQVNAAMGSTVNVQSESAIDALKTLVGDAFSNVSQAMKQSGEASTAALSAVSESRGVPGTFADYAKWLVPAAVVIVAIIVWAWKGGK